MCPTKGIPEAVIARICGEQACPPSNLTALSAGINQALGAGNREIHVVVAVNRQVGHQEGGRGTPRHGSRVMDHVLKQNVSRVGVSKHHHPKRVTHQQEIDAGFVQELCRGIVVGCESRDWSMASLRASDGIGSNLIHYLTMNDGVE